MSKQVKAKPIKKVVLTGSTNLFKNSVKSLDLTRGDAFDIISDKKYNNHYIFNGRHIYDCNSALADDILTDLLLGKVKYQILNRNVDLPILSDLQAIFLLTLIEPFNITANTKEIDLTNFIYFRDFEETNINALKKFFEPISKFGYSTYKDKKIFFGNSVKEFYNSYFEELENKEQNLSVDAKVEVTKKEEKEITLEDKQCTPF